MRWWRRGGQGLALVAVTCMGIAGSDGPAPNRGPMAVVANARDVALPEVQPSVTLDIDPAGFVPGAFATPGVDDLQGITGPAGESPLAPPPPSFEADVAAGAPPPPPVALHADPFAGVTPTGGTWAVEIGINDYPGTSHDLRSAVNDATTIDAALERAGVPGDHRLLLRDRQVTADVVRLAADWLVAHAGPDAVAVFAYAGHVRELGGGTEAIVGADGGIVTDADLASHLARLAARQSWIVIAGCYGGGFTELLAPGRVLTAAAPAGRVAYESDAFGRSYLVEYMVERGMIGGRAGGSSVQEAFGYATRALAEEHPARQPVEYDDSSGPIDLRPPHPSAAPPAASPAPAPGPDRRPPSEAGTAGGGSSTPGGGGSAGQPSASGSSGSNGGGSASGSGSGSGSGSSPSGGSGGPGSCRSIGLGISACS